MKPLIFSIIFLFIVVTAAFPLTVNKHAPLFYLRDSNGEGFYLSNYIGNTKKESVNGIILNFFSSVCEPCKKELPILNSLTDELNKKGIKVIIIGYKEDFDVITDFLTKLKVDKPIILSDVYGKVGNKYGVYHLPLTVLISSDGRAKDIIKGELPNMENTLREKVKVLLR
jgi:peroxiredoxin